MKRIIERWYNFLGYEIHIRIVPYEFKRDLRRLHNLIDDGHWEDFHMHFAEAKKRWGANDVDLIRAGSLANFLEGEDES